jgi:hypothetical protein
LSRASSIGSCRFRHVTGWHRFWFVTVRFVGNIRFWSSQVSKIGVMVFWKSSGEFTSGFLGQASLWNQGYGRLWLLLGRRVLQRVSFQQGSFFLRFGCVVSFGWSNWVLPKIEFVVKCCQEGYGSGSKAKSLAQPENA